MLTQLWVASQMWLHVTIIPVNNIKETSIHSHVLVHRYVRTNGQHETLSKREQQNIFLNKQQFLDLVLFLSKGLDICLYIYIQSCTFMFELHKTMIDTSSLQIFIGKYRYKYLKKQVKAQTLLAGNLQHHKIWNK